LSDKLLSDNPTDGSVTSSYPYKGTRYVTAMSYHCYPQYRSYNLSGTTWLDIPYDSSALVKQFEMSYYNHLWVFRRNGVTGHIPFIVTETGVSSKPIGDTIGGMELQRNYFAKMATVAHSLGIEQVCFFADNFGSYCAVGFSGFLTCF
jgi:hypothetical protein